MKNLNQILVQLIILFFSFQLFGQSDYYWVGGNGNWSNYSSHWATSSGGNIFHTTSPGSNDKVIFDSNSFSQANQTVTLDSDNQSFKDMSWIGVTDNPKFNMSGKTFEVHGKVEYDPNMQFQSVGTLSFVSSSTGSIISGGHNLGNIYIRKPSGTFHLLSPIRASHFEVRNGSTFYTNDYDIRASYLYFHGGTTTTTIYTGTSELLIEGGQMQVYYQSNSSSSKYLEANIVSSTIILDNATLRGRYSHSPKTNDINFGHVISRNSSNRDFGEGVDRVRRFEIQKGTNNENYEQRIHYYFEGIIDTLDIESKKVKFETATDRNPKIGVFNVKGDGVTIEISHGSTITVSNSLSFESSSCSVVNIKSNSAGNQATINYVSGVTTATNLSIRDISFTGSGTLTALSSVDGGNNTGISISENAPRNMYWIGGTGNWSDPIHWSTSDGGTGNVCAPTPNDNIFFTSNSFSAANQEITLNVDNIGIVNMDWTGVTNNPKFNMGGKTMEITGSVTYTADMTFQSAGTLSFLSTDTTSIYTGETTTNSARNLGNIYIRKPSGTFHLLSPIRASHFEVRNGSTFYTNDYDIRASYLYFHGGTTTTTIYTGTSELLIEGGQMQVYYQSNSSSSKYLEANIVSSTIILDNATLRGRYSHSPKTNDINFGHVISRNSSNRDFGEGVDRVRRFEIQKGTNNENYEQRIHYYFEGIIDTLDIESKKVKFETATDRNPKIGVFNVKGDGVTIEISHGSTITVSNSLSFESSSCSVVNIKSNSAGNQATINYVSGVTTATNLSIRDISFTGSGTLTALSSVDGGNNSGISISQQASRNMYWIGGTGNWSDPIHWSTSDGGTGNVCAPTPNDNIFFTSNSFSAANQEITLNVDNIGIVNMDWTGVTNNPKFNMGGKTMEITGSVTYTADMTFQSAGTLSFLSTDTTSIYTGETTTNSARNLGNIYIRKPSGTFHLLSPIRASHFEVRNGSTFYTNDYDIRASYLYFHGGTTTTTIYTGTSELLIEGGQMQVYYQSNSSSSKYLEANIVSSTIILDNATLRGRYSHSPKINDINFGHVISRNSSNRDFGEGVDRVRRFEIQKGTNNENYEQRIHYYFEGIIDTLDIESKKVKFETATDRNPKIGVFNVKGDGATIEISHGSTITVSNTLNFESKSGTRNYIKSNSSGSIATINYHGNDVCADYIRVKDITLVSSSTIALGPYSQNEGNTSGFNFNTDTSNTISGMTISVSPTGLSYYENQPISFVISSTYSNNNSATFHFFVNAKKTQSSTSTTFSGNNLKDGDKVFGSVEIPYTGTVTGCNFTTIGKTDDITLSLNLYPVITSSTYSQTNNTVAVTFNEPVFTANSGSGNLIPSDFEFSLTGGTGVLNSNQPTSVSKSGNTYTLGLNISNQAGSEVLTIKPKYNQIFDKDGRRSDQNQSNNSVRLGTVSASLLSAEVSSDNLTVMVTFSENVFSTVNGSGALEPSDFILEMSGGTATLSSTTPISIFSDNFKYSLGFTFGGVPNGNEVINVKLADNSIFDIQGVVLPQIQTNSSSNLKADADADGIANPVDLCPNTANGTAVNMNGCADSASKYFWVGGSGNWSDFSNHWATTSGGNVFHSRSPNGNDNVYFDRFSFTASGQTITVDSDASSLKNMSWTGVTNNPTFNFNGKSIDVFGSVIFAENMTISSANLNFSGTTTSTLDSKGNFLNYVYVRGSDLSLAGPLKTYQTRAYSGAFRTNNHELTTRYFNVSQSSNTSLTMDLGTSSITIEYEMEWTQFYPGNYTTNVSSATIILGGRTFYDFGDSQWGEIRVVENPQWNGSTRYINTYNNHYSPSNNRYHPSIKKIDATQTLDKINLEVRNADEVEISASSDINNLSAKVLKLKGNGSIYRFGGTINVSNTLEIGVDGGCAITTFKSTSDGNTATINSAASTVASYLDIKDIIFNGASQIQTTPTFTPTVNDGQNAVIYKSFKINDLANNNNQSEYNAHPTSSSDFDAMFDYENKKTTQWIYYGRDTATKAFTWPWSGGGWANLLPSTSNGQNFGWEITSNFVPAQSGTYSFEISSDDKSDFWMDQNQDGNLTNTGVGMGNGARTVDIGLTAGQSYPFRVRYEQGGGSASLYLKWKQPGDTNFTFNASEIVTNASTPTASTGSLIANNSIDNGNNSGFTINTVSERDFYWVGGTGNWSDGNEWSFSSGGSVAGCPPSSGDNIYFDSNSFTGSGQTVTIDIDNAAVNNMSWTGVVSDPTFNFNGKNLDVFGSIAFTESMTINSANMDFMSSPMPKANSIVANFPFNGNVEDHSGNSNHGTIQNNGASSSTDRFGFANSAYAFSGVAGGGINIGNGIDLSGSYTISLYAKLDDTAAYVNTKSALFGHGTQAANQGLHVLMNPSVGVRLGHYNNDYDVGTTTASYYTSWRHYVFVYDGSDHSRKVYLDGQLVSSNDTYDAVDYTGTGNFIIGNHPWGNNERFDGVMDDFIIWNEPLTASDVSSLYGKINQSTLDSKGNFLNYVYVRGSDLSLAGPLKTYQTRAYSGAFRTNNHELTTRYFNVSQSSNTSLTMDLGTSSITIEYEMEWTQFYPGNYTTNVSSATIILGGRTFYDFGDSQWGEIRVVENPQWNGSTRYINTYNNHYSPSNNRYHPSIKKIDATQTLDKINLEVRNADEVEISASSDINNLSAKVLKLKGNGSIYRFGGTINVSNTLEIGVDGGCAITTFKSTSDGNTATINSAASTVASYLEIKDIIFTSSNSSTLTANNSVDNGNNSGINFGLLGNRTFYWVGGAGNWSDGSHWATTSGGNPGGCPPSSGDDIYFDSNSFTGSGQSVTIDIDNAGLKNMSWTGVTNNPTFNFNGKSIDVFGSVIFAENMTISSANLNFSGTTTSTLDSKGNFLNYVYVRGSDLSLAGPLKTYQTRAYSGAFRTNNHELTTRYFNVSQSSNTSLTMDLGTSSITIEYEMEWTQFYPGNYTTNVSSATIILGGRTFYDFGDSQWGEIRVVENPQWNGSTRYINTYNNHYSPSNNRYHPSIKKIDATQTLDKINLEVRNADEVEISASSDINNLSAKVLKLKGNGSIYRFGGTINVSNTLDLTSNLGVVNTLTSTSNGNQSTLNYDGPFCIDYAAIRDIVFSNSVTVTAGPNSVDNGNNVGIEFFTDNNITIQSFTITSSMGTSIADFEQSSFTASSTTGFDPNMTLNWYVNNQLKQSGTSTTFSPGLITENYTVECATELPYTGGQTGSCAFIVKAKSNTINMTVSRNPIIKETKLTADNQFIKVRFSKPVFTNSNGTGDLVTSDFRLYLSGGNATLSSSYPTSVVKDGEFYKLTFGLNGKYNGQEQITVKPHGDSNIYDSGGLRAYQNTQSNNVVTLNYNPPIIDGVSVNSDLNELTIVFSEPVNGSDQSPYNVPLKYNVLHLSVSGGAATLDTPLPSSISGSLDTYKVGFTLSGTPNGNEIFQVTPVFNSIFDLQGFPASHLQDYNTTCTNCDTDNDGVIDARDSCPNTVSGTIVDQNGCSDDQKDSDYDGVPDYLDYCLNTALGIEVNANGCAETQTNQQSPTIVVEDSSVQENPPTPVQIDPNDIDSDGFSNSDDAFPNNPDEYLDTDGDGIGDNADQDDDNDGFTDSDEALCKTNPKDSNSLPTDNDGDQIVDCIDKDDDNDGVLDKDDDFPLDDTEYMDTDGDGIGNNADEDDDGDGYKDQDEISCESDPLKRFSKPRDYDGDLIPDCIDTDDDDDGCLDEQDLFPFNDRECTDSDGDGLGDNSDIDADNDGIIDAFDDFPTDPNESKDTDGDGIGDNADLDDNNDGFPEDPVINSAGEEVIPIFVSELLTPNQPGEEAKWRIVNIDKYPSANVKVYSPTGLIVYESWSYKNDWDGKDKNGKSLPTGPYLYIIDRGVETLVEEGWLYIFN